MRNNTYKSKYIQALLLRSEEKILYINATGFWANLLCDWRLYCQWLILSQVMQPLEMMYHGDNLISPLQLSFVLSMHFVYNGCKPRSTKFAYMILLSNGICPVVAKRRVFLPFILFKLNPWAKCPTLLQSPFSYTCFISDIVISLSIFFDFLSFLL